MHASCGCGLAIAFLFGAAPILAASDAQDSPTRSAADAFGERVGIDSVGLYSQNQTRGFDLLASSAAFRIDGFYFQPAASPSESLIQGSSVNVGIAGAALDLPSPTGVVTYRLREPGSATGLQVTAGMRDGGSAHVEAVANLADKAGRFGLVGHALYEPHVTTPTGQTGPFGTGAVVARWRLAPDTSIRAFASWQIDRHDGDIGVLADGPGVPPPLRPYHDYGPRWARSRADGGNFGLLAEHRRGHWSAGLGLIHSISVHERGDVAILSIDKQGQAASTLYYMPRVSTRSDSAEAKVAREFGLFGAEHRIGLAVRMRDTRAGRAEATAFDAGRFTLADGPVDVPAPALPGRAVRGSDRIVQRIVSATYGLQWHDRLQLRLGAHANRYARTVDGFDGTHARSVDDAWLYSASVIWQPNTRFRLFASRVSGLEESGSAPSAAVNRGEVLPPVKARQSELGLRYAVAPELNLIVAGFDIRKPIYGLRPDSVYAPIGTVRHRGIEASLTGKIGAGTTIVVGGNIVRPRLSGPLVDAGLVGRVAPGVSRVNGTISVDQQLGGGWSADLYLLYEGRRRRDQNDRTELSGVPFDSVGVRYSWTSGKTPLSLRAQLVNALVRRGYYATPYGPLVPVPPFTYRLLLSAGF